MFSSPARAPDTPEWLMSTVLCLTLSTTVMLLFWAWLLERKYISPFTLRDASNGDKWRKAAQLALMQTAMVPLLGLAAPLLSPYPNQFPGMSLACGSLWLVVLPVATVLKRWEFERLLNLHRHFDQLFKDKKGIFRLWQADFTSLGEIFIPADQKRSSSGSSSGEASKK